MFYLLIYFLRIHWRIYGGICCQIGFCFCSLTLASNIKKIKHWKESGSPQVIGVILKVEWKNSGGKQQTDRRPTFSQWGLFELFALSAARVLQQIRRMHFIGSRSRLKLVYHFLRSSSATQSISKCSTWCLSPPEIRRCKQVSLGLIPLPYRHTAKASLCLVKYAALPHPLLLDMLYCVSVNLLNPKL